MVFREREIALHFSVLVRSDPGFSRRFRALSGGLCPLRQGLLCDDFSIP
jgi:hypothetical protein